ncbi:serine hydrolase [Patescibacteria group bacterium]|nr:serine hydrolase [Patescibacteria group bacterium]MBU1500945.1 serine hydrolase [Patescibacteria group bacterium]MBU2080575.1 serine hydrolase [Patescibacteria group bacterium]MBU2124349.1 serine hydrolase [Patescibacteria group bacterium]MBU2194475.1 serine hydrolase [Patescibacteria group bacterium]
MTTENPDLKTLIRKLEKRHQKKQATTALAAGTGVLALTVLVAPLFMQPVASQVVEAPQPFTPVASPDAFADVRLEGKAAIVFDLTTQETLYERNARSQLPLASLTKLLTVYAAANTLAPESQVVISSSALAAEGESGFTEGETFTFTDLARFVLISSSNDGAAAIAEAAATKQALSGKNLLAGAAAAAGLSQTYALNGTGLDESTSVSGGYGSAYDVARLSGALLEKAPEIAHATVASRGTVRSTTGVVHTLPNTNPNVVSIPNLLLSKTGFTDLAGGNLAVVYDAGIGHPVAIVVLGSTREGRFNDVERLIARTHEYFIGSAP